ncbi:glycoside hydrolase superfamily [Diplogelasinospora grovesii]|uniref:chitinase n=1 Tax=Diplogelasinospora grovesii TaxID=303347 RepID=A0AAN6N452_9PEZI|nr:glycoside hydrolase superfamily [Diplogelasinospora grovesii]
MGNTCTYIQAQAGDGCWALAQRCGITQDQLQQYNTAHNFCNTIQVGEYVCCSAGSLPDFSPKPYSNGTCYTYTAQPGDTCYAIATANRMTVDKITQVNNLTWGWTGCSGLQIGQRICLSGGTPPFPAPVANAVCGPQVPGTVPATGSSPWGWAWYNQCPLNACCDKWGQCGITPEFCTNTTAPNGAPGTSAHGTNGCISNCGTDVKRTGVAPQTPFRIAYFEAWNKQRPCATMDISKVTDGGRYTHVHFGFANITANWQVDVSGARDQFGGLVALKGIKRILSFGGWGFSTDPYTFNIFRTGVLDGNRQTLAANVAKFIVDNNLDGVDFDWEYPGAQDIDIPTIPPDSLDSGKNYAAFLGLVRSHLPSDKSLSIAIPASYWYLKGFHPILQFEGAVSYYVYMTYDLHGQWDYNNKFSNPGCPNGNCLRSHINKTEIEYALAMATKAGIASTRIVPGLALYGRAFQMTDPSCTGVNCTFTGPQSGAPPGRCSQTAGYLSNIELEEILAQADDPDSDTVYDVTQYQDEGDVLIFNGTWVSWLTPGSYNDRQSWYDSMHFGGNADWAIDLNVTYSNDGTGDLVDGDDDWPQFEPCASMTFSTLEDLQNAQGGIGDARCVSLYTLQTLIAMLDTAYANYTDVNNGYDAVFGYYVTYMMKLVPEILENAFMWNMSTTGQYAVVPNVGYGMLRRLHTTFDCTLSDGTKTACANINTAQNERTIEAENGPTALTLRDQDAYNAALATAGLFPDWVVLGDYSITREVTMPHGGRKWNLRFAGFPIQNASMVVPNPKDIVTKGIGNIPSLRSDMAATAVSIMTGFWSGGGIDDPAQAFSAPVFMLMEAVDGMAQAKQLGQQEEQTEEEEERKRRENIILLIVSVVFMFVPVVGEEAAAAAGLATLAKAIAIAGELGNAALAIYDTVQDPSSAIINILGMLFGVGSITKATRDGTGIGAIAKLRRGMKPEEVTALGKIFSGKDGVLQSILGKACKM